MELQKWEREPEPLSNYDKMPEIWFLACHFCLDFEQA